MVVVARLAARAPGLACVTITSTLAPTNAAASSGHRSLRPLAHRYSRTAFWRSAMSDASKLWEGLLNRQSCPENGTSVRRKSRVRIHDDDEAAPRDAEARGDAHDLLCAGVRRNDQKCAGMRWGFSGLGP